MTQTAASLPRRLEASQHPLMLQLLSPFYSSQGFRKGRHSRKHTFFKSTRQFVNQTVKITVLSFCFFSLRAVFFSFEIFLERNKGLHAKRTSVIQPQCKGRGVCTLQKSLWGHVAPSMMEEGKREGEMINGVSDGR